MKNLGVEKFAKHFGTEPQSLPENCKVLISSMDFSYRNIDILTQILKSADYDDADVQYVSSKPTMIPKRMIDISLAKEKLGFEPKVSLQEGIRRTFQWYKKYYKNSSPEDKK